MTRNKRIYRVTLAGCAINAILLAGKFIAGVLGNSSAMIASAVHSLSDLTTDIIVLLFVRLSGRPKNKRHNYGYGKYETLATTIIGLLLLFAGLTVCVEGAEDIYNTIVNGKQTTSPGYIALIVALACVILKEWIFRFMKKAGKELNSEVIEANAWHHRSDAFSALGTSLGIAGAIFLGDRWAILDPITAMITSLFIIHEAARLVCSSVNELLEKSLPDEIVEEIKNIALKEDHIEGIEDIYTRNIGNKVAIELRVLLPQNITVAEADSHIRNIEVSLRRRFGETAHIIICIQTK